MDNIRSKEHYIAEFKAIEESLNGEASSAFHRLRKNAIAKFEELGFPTVKNEDWKYTNISSLLNHEFKSGSALHLSKSDLEKFTFKGLDASIIVFINGVYSDKLTSIKKQAEGIIIESLSSVIKNNPSLLLEHFGKYSEIENGFTALNTANVLMEIT